MRLQKLLYYAQSRSLARRGVPLFPESVEAWPYGPVVPAVYSDYESQRGEPLVRLYGGDESELSDGERELVAEVWEAYGSYSASSLLELVRGEQPWIDARAGYGPLDSCAVEITQAAMAARPESLGVAS